jgi:hypothetical protein
MPVAAATADKLMVKTMRLWLGSGHGQSGRFWIVKFKKISLSHR